MTLVSVLDTGSDGSVGLLEVRSQVESELQHALDAARRELTTRNAFIAELRAENTALRDAVEQQARALAECKQRLLLVL